MHASTCPLEHERTEFMVLKTGPMAVDQTSKDTGWTRA